MASTRQSNLSKLLCEYGWDLLLGSIAAFYVVMVPYTKVEESFNVQAMHDILYHRHKIEKYDHLDFPGVVPRTFIGSFVVSCLASPVAEALGLFHLPKIYSLIAVRLVLGSIIIAILRSFRIQIRRKFGYQVEAYFAVLTAIQFHLLFYCTRPLPNIFAFGLVNLAYSFWFEGNFLATLRCLTFATVVFRCDMVLLLAPIGLGLLLGKSVSLGEAVKACAITALLSIGLTVILDSLLWKRLLWPELEVFWFNTILNRSSEWGTHPFHWYFTSALPRSLLVAYPLCLVGMFLDRRILGYVIPVLAFVLLYSKLPHKELRFIIGAVPVFNVSAAIAASRVYINRKKNAWRWLYIMMLVTFVVSLGCSAIMFMASYNNYPGAYALQALHTMDTCKEMEDKLVHIDPFSAMNGISRFSEELPWRYSKEEGITLQEYGSRNFTYLLNEHSFIDGYKCLFAVRGFSRVILKFGLPLVNLVKESKVFVHGNLKHSCIALSSWPGCS